MGNEGLGLESRLSCCLRLPHLLPWRPLPCQRWQRLHIPLFTDGNVLTGGGESKGQVWTPHCAPAAPAFTRPSSPSQFVAYPTWRRGEEEEEVLPFRWPDPAAGRPAAKVSASRVPGSRELGRSTEEGSPVSPPGHWQQAGPPRARDC